MNNDTIDFLIARHALRIPNSHRPPLTSRIARLVAKLDGRSENYLAERFDAIKALDDDAPGKVIPLTGEPCTCSVGVSARGGIRTRAENASRQEGCVCRRMTGLREDPSGPKAVFSECTPEEVPADYGNYPRRTSNQGNYPRRGAEHYRGDTMATDTRDTRDEKQLWAALEGNDGVQCRLDKASRDSSASEEELTALRSEVAELRKLLSAKVRERTTRTTRTHKDFVKDPKADEDDDSEEQSPALKDALAKPGQKANQEAARKGMKKACSKMDHFDAAESDQIEAMIEDARAIANQQNKRWGAEEAGMARGRAQDLVAAARFDAADTVDAAAARNRADRHTAHMSSNRAEAMSPVQDTPVVTIDAEDDPVTRAAEKMRADNHNAWRVGR